MNTPKVVSVFDLVSRGDFLFYLYQMNFTTLIGLFAATCTTISFIPQVVQILKTKDTKGISLLMYIVFTLGIACWLVYGILLNDIPIIIANAITLLLASLILIFKIRYR